MTESPESPRPSILGGKILKGCKCNTRNGLQDGATKYCSGPHEEPIETPPPSPRLQQTSLPDSTYRAEAPNYKQPRTTSKNLQECTRKQETTQTDKCNQVLLPNKINSVHPQSSCEENINDQNMAYKKELVQPLSEDDPNLARINAYVDNPPHRSCCQNHSPSDHRCGSQEQHFTGNVYENRQNIQSDREEIEQRQVHSQREITQSTYRTELPPLDPYENRGMVGYPPTVTPLNEESIPDMIHGIQMVNEEPELCCDKPHQEQTDFGDTDESCNDIQHSCRNREAEEGMSCVKNCNERTVFCDYDTDEIPFGYPPTIDQNNMKSNNLQKTHGNPVANGNTSTYPLRYAPYTNISCNHISNQQNVGLNKTHTESSHAESSMNHRILHMKNSEQLEREIRPDDHKLEEHIHCNHNSYNSRTSQGITDNNNEVYNTEHCTYNHNHKNLDRGFMADHYDAKYTHPFQNKQKSNDNKLNEVAEGTKFNEDLHCHMKEITQKDHVNEFQNTNNHCQQITGDKHECDAAHESLSERLKNYDHYQANNFRSPIRYSARRKVTNKPIQPQQSTTSIRCNACRELNRQPSRISMPIPASFNRKCGTTETQKKCATHMLEKTDNKNEIPSDESVAQVEMDTSPKKPAIRGSVILKNCECNKRNGLSDGGLCDTCKAILRSQPTTRRQKEEDLSPEQLSHERNENVADEHAATKKEHESETNDTFGRIPSNIPEYSFKDYDRHYHPEEKYNSLVKFQYGVPTSTPYHYHVSNDIENQRRQDASGQYTNSPPLEGHTHGVQPSVPSQYKTMQGEEYKKKGIPSVERCAECLQSEVHQECKKNSVSQCPHEKNMAAGTEVQKRQIPFCAKHSPDYKKPSQSAPEMITNVRGISQRQIHNLETEDGDDRRRCTSEQINSQHADSNVYKPQVTRKSPEMSPMPDHLRQYMKDRTEDQKIEIQTTTKHDCIESPIGHNQISKEPHGSCPSPKFRKERLVEEAEESNRPVLSSTENKNSKEPITDTNRISCDEPEPLIPATRVSMFRESGGEYVSPPYEGHGSKNSKDIQNSLSRNSPEGDRTKSGVEAKHNKSQVSPNRVRNTLQTVSPGRRKNMQDNKNTQTSLTKIRTSKIGPPNLSFRNKPKEIDSTLTVVGLPRVTRTANLKKQN
ncbi:uncharacterized protein [Periplaneta americana]|uniref:uncharacterized protein n=1 Tax=Periplaneta americana TaxID=6978 RepID=UPI0037E8F11E